MTTTIRLHHFAIPALLLAVVLWSGFTCIDANAGSVDIHGYLIAEGDTDSPEELKFPLPSNYAVGSVGAAGSGLTLFLQPPRTVGVFAKLYQPRAPPLKPLSITHL